MEHWENLFIDMLHSLDQYARLVYVTLSMHSLLLCILFLSGHLRLYTTQHHLTLIRRERGLMSKDLN
jgi:hypothetical protein